MKKLKVMAFLCSLCILAGGCAKEEKAENKPITLKYQGKNYKGRYTGLIKNGEPEGGTFSYKKGRNYLHYKGGFSDQEMSGRGTLKTNFMKTKFSDTDCTGVYEGEVLDGEAWSHGTFTFKSPADLKDSVYKGDWSYNKMDGKGQLTFSKKGWGGFLGNFDDGYFAPTKSDTFQSLGTLINTSYKVSANAKTFINKHGNLFMAKDEDSLKEYTDTSAEYHDVLKAPAAFGNKLMKFSNFPVLNPTLNEKMFGRNISFILLGSPSDNIFIYVICLGPIKDVPINSYRTVYGLPLASSIYESNSGKRSKVLVLAGSYIKDES